MKIELPAGGAAAVYNSSGLAYYRHSDWLGSLRFASTPSQTMYLDTAYAPFGEAYAGSGTADPSFTGMDQDTSSNVYDFPAREYGIQGRWPSPDPLGIGAVDPTDPQSWNRYAYVRNSPLSMADPTGLAGCDGTQGTAEDCASAAANCQSTGASWDCFVAASVAAYGCQGFLSFSSNCSGGGYGLPVPIPSQPGCTWDDSINRITCPEPYTDCLSANSGCAPIFMGLDPCSGGQCVGSDPGGNSSSNSSPTINRIKTVNRCAGELSQAGSVSNLSHGRVPELLGSNTFGDVASLATGNGGIDQAGALGADALAHATPVIVGGLAVGTVTSIGTAISHTPGVYNPITIGTTTKTVGMTTVGKGLLGAVEGVLTGKILLDAGVYVGDLVVCSIQ